MTEKAQTPTGADELTDQAFRHQNLKGTMFEATYSGALSFCRRRYSRDLTNIDIAVTGIPFDSAVTNRPGCRFGPRAIREASTRSRIEKPRLWFRSVRYSCRRRLR